MNRCLVMACAVALLLGSVAGAQACSYDGMAVDLTRADPDSLTVALAMRAAYQNKRIAEPIVLPGGFGMRRLLNTLQRLDERLGVSPGREGFSLLLVESGLWVHYRLEGDHLKSEVHAAAPGNDEAVVITGESVVLALEKGQLSADDALASDLVHIRATASQHESIARHWRRAFAR